LAFTAHEIGAGPLVLLIHGFPDGPATWRDVAPRVAEAGFRCVAVTLRGYQATSLSPEGQYRLADLAGDVASWIEGLGEQQAHLIGHDWGATIAFAATVHQPERVASLSMISVPNPMRFGTAVGQDKAQMKRSSYIMFFQLGGLSDWWVGRRNAAFVERLWRQAGAKLPEAVRPEVAGYGMRLLERFANPALRHRLLQIAMDGSNKLPQRLVATLRDARRAGLPHDAPLWAIAAWMRFAAGTDERGGTLPLDDPLAARLRPIAAGTGDATDTVRALLGVREVFGEDLAGDEALVAALATALATLRARGSLGAFAADGAPVALSSAASRSDD
jgi:pimeloyl-ACP methyl ester carboxylesterase